MIVEGSNNRDSPRDGPPIPRVVKVLSKLTDVSYVDAAFIPLLLQFQFFFLLRCYMPRRHQGTQTSPRNLSQAEMRAMYDYNRMVLAHPLPNYAHIRQWNLEGYVQRWMHAFTPNNKYHFSVAPHSNENGFHITSANGRQRVYYDRAGRRVTRPQRPEGPGAVSSVQYPKSDWNHDARLMAAFLNSFRR